MMTMAMTMAMMMMTMTMTMMTTTLEPTIANARSMVGMKMMTMAIVSGPQHRPLGIQHRSRPTVSTDPTMMTMAIV